MSNLSRRSFLRTGLAGGATLAVSTVSTAPTPVTPSEVSPRPVARIVPGGSLSDLERALLSTLPYFEGDYLPYVGEDLLKEIYQESLKPKPTRSVGLLTDCDV